MTAFARGGLVGRSLALVLLTLLAGCGAARGSGPGAGTSPLLDPAAPTFASPAPDLYRVRLDTTRGEVLLEVVREWAPAGADRFYHLVRHGFYDGSRFFRVVPGFIAQFGLPPDPRLSEIWARHRIADDPVTLGNERGSVSFASAGVDSRSVQVFINLGDNRRLDGLGFAPFATVLEGIEVLDALWAGYGEIQPGGPGPDQQRVHEEGEPYLERDYPRLDLIRRASIVR